MSGRTRFDLLPALGVWPSTGEVVGGILDRALADASKRAAEEGREVVVLDAACGRVSALRPFRGRIGRLVGVDVRPPADASIGHLDEYVIADVCTEPDAFAPETFDLVLASFALEHLDDPGAALANLARWTRPGGTIAITTPNRRHPFVAAYLDMPPDLRARLQPVVKAAVVDAHPVVGACNEPRTLARALRDAGWADVRVVTVGHLARAWGRTWPTFAAGLLGDVATRGMPQRRSTIVAVATRPESALASAAPSAVGAPATPVPDAG